MQYGIRGCGHSSGSTANLSDIGPHVANFLLLRGKYAYLSTGWSGCTSLDAPNGGAERYGWNKQWLDADYGVPVEEICSETAAGSGVFVREWSKARIQMDCNSWTPKVTFK